MMIHRKLDNFKEHLTPEALVVYSNVTNSTFVEVNHCTTHGEFLSKVVMPFDENRDKRCDNCNVLRKVHLMQHMGATLRITAQCLQVRPGIVQLDLDMKAKEFARYLNKGVEHGLLDYGVMSECFYIPLAVTGPSQDFYIGLSVGSKYNMDELNRLYKDYRITNRRLFYPEGQLP